MTPPMLNSKRKRGGEEREAQSPSKFLIISEAKPIRTVNPISVFRCKTCGKEFSTFQALGGHRASHTHKNPNYVSKKLSHECHVCYKQFETGQALGGHMTRHRKKDESSKGSTSWNSDVIHEEEKSMGGDSSAIVTRDFFPMEPNATLVNVVPVLERADSWLELKLAPLGGYVTKHREKDESSKGSSSNSDVIHEKFVGYRGDSSALATRDFFPMGPMWVNAAPVEVVPHLERADSWLDLKLA